jgi:hypothetical protein
MLYQIACMPPSFKVVGADINEGVGRGVIEEALHIAHNLGYFPDMVFRRLDLFDIDGTAQLLKEVKPDVICHLASLGSWWITRLLPEDIYSKICPIGPWLPNHLTLAYKLMRAVDRSGVDAKVVNGAYPDLTNVVLGKLGMPPVCGGGNMDLVCERIRRIVARELSVPAGNVSIFGVGHHGTSYTSKLQGPFWLKVLVGGDDFSDQFPQQRIRELYEATGFGELTQFQGPLVEQHRTASAFLKNVLSIHFDTGRIHMCISGPNGLPGGYPTRLGAKGAEIVLPKELTLEEAVRINEEGALWDGILRVKDDGTVIYTEEATRNMREVLGYECEEFKALEMEERAKELNTRLRDLYKKHKINY